jgi:uncharacterized membrane protein YhaH (DUF805 family)
MKGSLMGVYNRDEPLGREGYVRPAFVWLVIPYIWLLVMFRLPTDILPPQSVMSFVVAWVPFLLAFFAFVSLSMRRLLDLGAPRGLAWLSLVPGAAVPMYIVLAVAPSPARTNTGLR